MALSDEKLKKLIAASPLFIDSGSNNKLDLSKLTSKQQIQLARKGRAKGIGSGRIFGGMTNLERSIVDKAGQTLANDPSAIVSNVQRNKEWRKDQRTLGGIKNKIKAADTRSSNPLPDFGSLPNMPEMPELPTNVTPTGIASNAGLQGLIQFGQQAAKTIGQNAMSSGLANTGTNLSGSFPSTQIASQMGTMGAESLAAQATAQSVGMHPSLLGAPSLTNEMIALGNAGAPQAAGLTAGSLLPLAGFALQGYNILKMGNFGKGKEGSGGINWADLLKRAESGEKSYRTTDLRGGNITFDLTDKTTLENIRSKIPGQLAQRQSGIEARGLDRGRREEAINLGYEDPTSRLRKEKLNTTGMSLKEIQNLYKDTIGPNFDLNKARQAELNSDKYKR